MKRCKINPNRGIISKMRCHNLNDDPKVGGVLTGDGQRNGLCHGTDSYCNRVDSGLSISAFLVSISYCF